MACDSGANTLPRHHHILLTVSVNWYIAPRYFFIWWVFNDVKSGINYEVFIIICIKFNYTYNCNIYSIKIGPFIHGCPSHFGIVEGNTEIGNTPRTTLQLPWSGRLWEFCTILDPFQLFTKVHIKLFFSRLTPFALVVATLPHYGVSRDKPTAFLVYSGQHSLYLLRKLAVSVR